MSDEACPRCGHPSDPHLMVATTFTETEAGKTPQGGVMLCHLKGCECFATWAVPQLGGDRESLVLPDERELAEMREALQG